MPHSNPCPALHQTKGSFPGMITQRPVLKLLTLIAFFAVPIYRLCTFRLSHESAYGPSQTPPCYPYFLGHETKSQTTLTNHFKCKLISLLCAHSTLYPLQGRVCHIGLKLPVHSSVTPTRRYPHESKVRAHFMEY